MRFLKALLDGNEREVKKLRRIAEQINALESQFEALSDAALADKTREFREKLAPYVARLDEAKAVRAAAVEPGEQGVADIGVKGAYDDLEAQLNALAPEAFAAVREASKRTLGMRHYDVQLIAGLALHQGRVAELATGEGKTLSATCPLYLNALVGKGAHLVTPNDYLARRDGLWKAPLFSLLGLRIGVIQGASERHGYGSAWIYEKDAHEEPGMEHLRLVDRQECYQCDIVYGTNAEFGFDYLRDNMALGLDRMVQRDHFFAIVDEMDSILIDEARTPLIISGMPEQSTDLYQRVDRVVAPLKLERDFTLDEKAKNAMLTEEGTHRVEEGLGVANLAEHVELMHHVSAAVRARFAYRRDIEYVVKDEKVIIVDEFTGRLMFGRRYSDGLHQAIEAKEGVPIEEETQTIATVTIQNYFRIYHKLAGMTGTAKTEEAEIRKIYGMDVVVVPTNLPMIRKDQADVIFKTEEQKFRAIVLDILEKHVRGQPILVGTRSIEVSERLSEQIAIGERIQLQVLILLLRERLLGSKEVNKQEAAEFHSLLNTPLDQLDIERLRPVARPLGVALDALDPGNVANLERLLELDGNREVLLEVLQDGIPHSVLNAKHHEKEAQIIAEAGRKHAVTIATNMAGRGVDIMLGGKLESTDMPEPTEFELSSGVRKRYPTPHAAEVARLGGLAIIGSERHESRRIDRQLRGRSGRQGDPGDSRFYLSLEDELWRLFGDKGKMFQQGWPEYERLEAGILTAAIERAQRKIEEHNFGIRKNTLEYDDVMNVHREVIYRQRREILNGADLRDTILEHAAVMVEDAVRRHCNPELQVEEWELRGLYDELDLLFDLSLLCRPADLEEKSNPELVEMLSQLAEQRYEQREEQLAQAGVDIREAERQIALQIIDHKWVEHLTAMDYLREGVWLRSMEQRDPLVVYKKEAFEIFNDSLASIQNDLVNWMFHVSVQPPPPAPPPRRTAILSPIEEDEEDFLPGLDPGANGALGSGRGQGSRFSETKPSGKKVGRNDPCPCGSGKKYKFCHLKSGGL